MPHAAGGTSLHWGVMERFRNYVGELEDGQERWDVETDESGRGIFPLVSDSRDSGARVLRFTGSVRFTGHGGFLNVSITDPQITIGADSMTVTIDSAPPGVRERRLEIARSPRGGGPATDGRTVFAGLGLTAAGAELLGSVYREGEPVDDAVWSPAEEGRSEQT
ncbi:hypothetical protein GCM10010461_17530 [Microbacterium aurantiacum]